MKKYYLLLLFNLLFASVFAQTDPRMLVPSPYNPGSSSGSGSLEMCSGINNAISLTGANSATNMGPVGCLGSTPNGSWYYIPMTTPPGSTNSSVTWTLTQTSPGGGLIDVDFIPVSYTHLTLPTKA